MVERLLLDRIEAKAAGPPIGGEHHGVMFARPHETEPPLAFMQLAFPRAEVALDAAVGQRLPVPSGHATMHFEVWHAMKMAQQ